MLMFTPKKLFGGAITVILPERLVDASDLREVPDTQEVFLYPDSEVSLVVEVLERAEPSDPHEAARFHFDALAHDNSASSYHVQSINVLTEGQDRTPPPIIVHGTQSVPKFNNNEPDQVQVFLAIYRIADKNVDLVLSMNLPIQTVSGGKTSDGARVTAEDDFNKASQSLNIIDFGLFA